MRRVFVDAGHLIALLHPRDTLHMAAKTLAQELDAAALVTTEMVLVEVLNYFASHRETLRRIATEYVHRIRASPRVTVHPQTSLQFEQALQRYAERSDKSWSLTDCASFLLLKSEGIREAAAHDQHFEQAGFVALLR